MMLPALTPLGGVLTGLFGVFAFIAHRRQSYLLGEVTAFVAGAGLLVLAACRDDTLAVIGWVAGLPVGVAGAIWWYRVGVQHNEALMARFTRRSNLIRAGRTDVREVQEQLPPPAQEYAPRQYHKTGQFFMGLDESGKPLLWRGSLPHVAIAGTTGSGKGRKLQDLAAQAVANGEALVYMDPKDDEWGPHALCSACNEAGVDYHFLRLMPDAPPQINLVAGAALWEVEELFTSTLDLSDTGSASDFYRAKDRAAARQAAELIVSDELTMAQAHARLALDEGWRKEAPGFLEKLSELATLNSINADKGFDLAQLVAGGGGLYVVGSMTLQPVRRAQQMLFVRIQQLASRRDRLAGPLRTVCVIADEAKYHISRPILQGLGASRDKGMRVIMAFQSFADLKDCPADMTPEMVIGAVVENTPCKLIYRLEDPDTALWLARKAGTILVDDETRTFGRNVALAETGEGARSVRQAEHFLFDTNKFLNLPAGWGVLFGQGIARACYVSPYLVTKDSLAITPVAAMPPPPTVVPTAQQSVLLAPKTSPKAAVRQRTHDPIFFMGREQ